MQSGQNTDTRFAVRSCGALNPRKTILLFIDMQVGLFEGGIPRFDARDVVSRINDSPVYFFSAATQMKTFIHRGVAFGNKPRGTWELELSHRGRETILTGTP